MSVALILLMLGCVIAAQSIPTSLPATSPADSEPADEGLAGPGAVEASPSLPRPVLGVTSCDLCGQRITETDAARTGGLCPECDDDIKFEALWGDS